MNCLSTLLSYIFPRHSPPTTHTSDTHPYKPFPEDNSPEKADPPIPLLSLPHPHPKKHKRVHFGPTADIPNRRLSSSSTSSLDANDSNIILPHRRNIRRRSIMKPPTALDQEMVFRNTCRMVAVAEQRLEMSYHHIMRGGGDLEAVLVEEECMLFDDARGLAALQGAMPRVQTLRRVGGQRRRLRKKWVHRRM